MSATTRRWGLCLSRRLICGDIAAAKRSLSSRRAGPVLRVVDLPAGSIHLFMATYRLGLTPLLIGISTQRLLEPYATPLYYLGSKKLGTKNLLKSAFELTHDTVLTTTTSQVG
jgi:hypothetical protein